MPEEGRAGDGARGTGRQCRLWAGQPGWDIVRHGKGRKSSTCPSTFSISWPLFEELGKG